jgi:hypothetical protein
MPYAPRELSAAGHKTVSNRIFKVYELVAPARRISEDLRDAAWATLPQLAATPVDEDTPAAGWCVLHRGEDAAYLLAYSWVWHEVLDVRVAVAGNPSLGTGGADETDFGVLSHRWMGCVWELTPLAHERSVWIKHVLAPAAPDVDSYLDDFFPDGAY